MDTFRSALMALVPSAECAQLSWQDLNMHDDWERIAETLFNVFVVHPIELDAAVVQSQIQMPLPRYDFDFDDYAPYSWIEVVASGEGSLALVRLLSRENPFDTVQLVRVNLESFAVQDHVTIPWEGVRFLLRRRQIDGSSDLIAEVAPIE